MKNPRISVIMSAFNAEEYIKQAIESVLNQSYKNIELILADDASTDATREIIDLFADWDNVRISHNSANKGKIETVNSLIELTTGEYLTIHDADDYSHPERFAKQLEFLKLRPSHVMCGTGYFELLGDKTRSVHVPVDLSIIRKNLPIISQFHGPTILFKKEILSHTGGLYRYFDWGEDIDFCTRVVEKFDATNLDEPLYFYRVHPNSMTNDPNKLYPDRFINSKLRKFLADQRKEFGEDCLMTGDFEALENKKTELLEKYMKNPDEVYFLFSQRMMHYGFKTQAIQSAWIATKLALSWRNIKNLIYTIFFLLDLVKRKSLESND